jgi:diacylglycerol kinase (ATP)
MPPVVSSSTLSKKAKRVAILVNPKAGPTASRPRAEQLASLLAEEGFQVEIFTDLAEAATLANRWHAEGTLRTLVGVGGDGTAAELANRIEPGVPLSPFPGGNANLLARYFHWSKNPRTACQIIAEGATARIDVGRANGRIFLLMAGCGFDAEVAERVGANRSGHITPLTYLRPILEVAWHYEYPILKVQSDDAGVAPIAAQWLFAFNLPCYGGGFRIAPHADGSDGLLDLCGFRRGRFWPCLASVLLQRHRRSPEWISQLVRRVQITSEADVPYQLDGDPGGRLPLALESLPGHLTLVVPREIVGVRSGSGEEWE